MPWQLKVAFRGIPVHAMTTEEVHELIARYGRIGAWAREAGYDAIQLGNSNAKLLDQFLSPFYNRRTDEFGGSLENRARILRLIRASVAEHAGDDFPCLVKVASEIGGIPGTKHTSFDDALRLAPLLEEWGFDALTPCEVSAFPDTTLCRGGVPDGLWTNNGMANRLKKAAPSRRKRAVAESSALGTAASARRSSRCGTVTCSRRFRKLVSIPVFAVGGIRTADEVNQILEAGEAAMVGIGRPFYAEPDLAERILGGDPGAAAVPQLEQVRVGANARHARRLLQPRGHEGSRGRRSHDSICLSASYAARRAASVSAASAASTCSHIRLTIDGPISSSAALPALAQRAST